MIKNENTRGGALDGESGALAGERRAGRGGRCGWPGREVWLAGTSRAPTGEGGTLAGTSRALAGESGALGRC